MTVALRTKLVWRGLRADYRERRDGTRHIDDARLDRAEAACREALTAYPALRGRPFCFPPALRAFYRCAGAQLEAVRDGLSFHDLARLHRDGFELAYEARDDSAPWMEVAHDDGVGVYVNCDPEDMLFGHVVRRDHASPWSSLVYERETWVDLVDFLAELASMPHGGL